MRERHVAVARLSATTTFNNTYQYVIAREDVHLSWLDAALAELDGKPPDVAPSRARRRSAARRAPCRSSPRTRRRPSAFVDALARRGCRRSPTPAYRSMMQVILGETLEQKRFFDQMLAGQDDLLGRRSNGPGSPGTGDGVMAVRWIE